MNKWLEFAGPPGVGKSALDAACARYFLRPSAIKSQSFRVTAEWRAYFHTLDSMYADCPGDNARFRNGLFRDVIRAATMCINDFKPYLFSQFLTQHALRLARLYENLSPVPRVVEAMPERPFTVLLCYAPLEVIAHRNHKRGHGREDQSEAGRVQLYLEATYALEKTLRFYEVPVVVLDTTESIPVNKSRLIRGLRHA